MNESKLIAEVWKPILKEEMLLKTITAAPLIAHINHLFLLPIMENYIKSELILRPRWSHLAAVLQYKEEAADVAALCSLEAFYPLSFTILTDC